MKLRHIVLSAMVLVCLLFCGTRVNAESPDYLVLEQDFAETMELTQDLYVDLNGYTMSGTIVTNGYKIYGMDSATDNYSSANMGYFRCVDEQGNLLVPQTHVKSEHTGTIKRYMTVPAQNGYSFHRFYLGITHINLKTATTGMGFKAVFCGDDMVKEMLDPQNAFGYTMQLEGGMPVRVYKPADSFSSGKTVSLRINGFDVERFGEVPLYAQVMLRLKDGTCIESTQNTATMRSVMEFVNDSYLNFTAAQLKAVRGLIAANPVTEEWNVDNILKTDPVKVFADAAKLSHNQKLSYTTALEGVVTSFTETYNATYKNVTFYMDVDVDGVPTSLYCYRIKSGAAEVSEIAVGDTVTVFGTVMKYYSTIEFDYTSTLQKLVKPVQEPIEPEPTEPEDTEPTEPDAPCVNHTDADNNGSCDRCNEDVTVEIDLYAVNDLHGKLVDGDTHPGVDELSTYLENARQTKDNMILLSSGDMWQGAAESNLTKGMIMTQWMNEMDFVSMTIGNHEYDWGEEIIAENAQLAEFPFLAINIYDTDTNRRVDYCESSVIVEAEGLQIGIIGAVGNCYSSISSDRTTGVYFITGSQLTSLVKAEANRLRNQGVDLVVYSLHGDYSSEHYDEALSNGYVDLVFEGHTHQYYEYVDSYGIYHLQGGGDNKGITHASVTYNTANCNYTVTTGEYIPSSTYSSLEDHPVVEQLLDQYSEQVSRAYEVLGNISYMSSTAIKNKVAELYVQAGLERWGDKYDIVLGGGSLNTRSPYNLYAGEVTYGDLMNVLPFDNRLALCSIPGSALLSQFINNTNYSVGYSDYGASIKNSIVSTKTYYVVVDTWSAYYAKNKLTIVEFYDDDVYARDLLADYFRKNN